MDRKAKQVGSSSSSSSFTDDLFGPKDPPPPPTTLFGSLLGPQSMAPGKGTTRPDYERAYAKAKHETTTDYNNIQKGRSENWKNSDYENSVRGEPCYFTSSIYYGSREDYTPSRSRNISPPHNFKKDGDGYDGYVSDDSTGYSIGNWWKGSVYY